MLFDLGCISLLCPFQFSTFSPVFCLCCWGWLVFQLFLAYFPWSLARFFPNCSISLPVFSEFSLSKSLASVLKTQPSFWKNTLRMMPPFFVAVVVILFLVSIAFSFGAKKRWLGLVWAFVLLVGCYISSFAVHIISPVVWVVPRSTVPFFLFCFYCGRFFCSTCFKSSTKVSFSIDLGSSRWSAILKPSL